MVKKSMLWDILLILISVIVILYKFNSIPADLVYDEVDFTRAALSLDRAALTPYTPLATGHSTPYFYIILASFKLFGVTPFALRLPAAMFGILSILVFSLILKQIFPEKKYSISFYNLKIPLYFLASLLLVSMRWYFHFARFSFEAAFLIFLELVSVYMLMRIFQKAHLVGDLRGRDPDSAQFSTSTIGKERKAGLHDTIDLKYTVLCGIFAGLAYNSYLPGRIFFLLPITMIIYLIYKKKLHWKGMILFLIPFVLSILPLNLYLAQHPDIRIGQLSYMQNTELTLQTKAQFFLNNTLKLPLMIFMPGKGDIWGVHNYPLKPALNPIMNLLFFGGMLYGLFKKRTLIMGLFFIWIFLASLPTLFTYPWENPNMLRTITLLLSIGYFSALGMLAVQEMFKKKSLQIFISGAIITIVIISVGYEIRTYYRYQASVIEDAFNLRQDVYGIKDREFQKLYFKLMEK